MTATILSAGRLSRRPGAARADAAVSAGRRLVAAASLMALLAAQPALAQPALAPAKPVPAAPAPVTAAPAFQPASRSDGLLTPPAEVDPGMSRPAPEMPARSTPVIHPRELHKGRRGNVEVVPK